MKRFIAVWLMLVSTLGLISLPAEAKPRTECRFGVESVRAVKHTIKCVAWQLPHVTYPKALSIAQRESGLGSDEINDDSGTCGIYQHQPHYWNGRYHDFYVKKRWGPGPNKCLHDRTNIIVSLTMVNRSGWGPWSL